MTQIFITSTSTFVVPSDFSQNNTIEAIGGGQGGQGGANAGTGGTGGKGATYVRKSGILWRPGASVSLTIGAGTSGTGAGGAAATAGGDTIVRDVFGTTVLLAPGGGSATAVVGDYSQVGGSGGVVTAGTHNAGSGGGGAGCFEFTGQNGGTVASTALGGSGGGGNDGGAAGTASAAASVAGTQGGSSFDGTAGGGGGAQGANNGTQGSHGSGGGGGGSGNGANAGNGGQGGLGTEFDAVTFGAGGGGGGGGGSATGTGGTGGNGGLYGGGAGGGGGQTTASGSGGTGGSGLILITYIPDHTADRYREYLGGGTLAAAAASLTVTVAPRNFLMIEIVLVGFNVADTPALQFNSDTGTNYQSRYVSYATAGVVPTDHATATASNALLTSGTSTHSAAILCEVANFPTTSKCGRVETFTGSGAAATVSILNLSGGFEWVNITSPITSIKLFGNAGNNLLAGSSIRVTGVDALMQ